MPNYVQISGFIYNKKPLIWQVSDNGRHAVLVACSPRSRQFIQPSIAYLNSMHSGFATSRSAGILSSTRTHILIKEVSISEIGHDDRFSDKPEFTTTTFIIENYDELILIQKQGRHPYAPISVLLNQDFDLNYDHPRRTNRERVHRVSQSETSSHPLINPPTNPNDRQTAVAIDSSPIPLTAQCEILQGPTQQTSYYQLFLLNAIPADGERPEIDFNSIDHELFRPFSFMPEKIPMNPLDNLFIVMDSDQANRQRWYDYFKSKLEISDQFSTDEKTVYIQLLDRQKDNHFQVTNSENVIIPNKYVLRLPYHVLFTLFEPARYRIVPSSQHSLDFFHRPPQEWMRGIQTMFQRYTVNPLHGNQNARQSVSLFPPVQVLNRELCDYYREQIESIYIPMIKDLYLPHAPHRYIQLLEFILQADTYTVETIKASFLGILFKERCQKLGNKNKGKSAPILYPRLTDEERSVLKQEYTKVVGEGAIISNAIDDLWSIGLSSEEIKAFMKENLGVGRDVTPNELLAAEKATVDPDSLSLMGCAQAIDKLHQYASGVHDQNATKLQNDNRISRPLKGWTRIVVNQLIDDVKNKLEESKFSGMYKELESKFDDRVVKKVNARLDQIENNQLNFDLRLQSIEEQFRQFRAMLYEFLNSGKSNSASQNNPFYVDSLVVDQEENSEDESLKRAIAESCEEISSDDDFIPIQGCKKPRVDSYNGFPTLSKLCEKREEGNDLSEDLILEENGVNSEQNTEPVFRFKV